MIPQYELYKVSADEITHDWLHEPVFVGFVNSDEWDLMQDTDDVFYDTFTNKFDGHTCAIEIQLTKSNA